MVGNLWEWTATELDAPALGSKIPLKEIRGGSWFVDHRKSTCQGIDGYPATNADQAFPDVGFRCCRGPVLQREPRPKPNQQCPTGMISGSSFCIDQFEYPNKKGVMPQGGLTYQQAKNYCEQSEKRLCTKTEWNEACQGLEGYRWPYGDTYEANRCVDAGGNTVEGQSGAQPSGHAQKCVSSLGVYDMSGNLWEWTAEKTLQGGGWNLSAGLGQCQSQAQAKESFQAGEFGVRCCKDPL